MATDSGTDVPVAGAPAAGSPAAPANTGTFNAPNPNDGKEGTDAGGKPAQPPVALVVGDVPAAPAALPMVPAVPAVPEAKPGAAPAAVAYEPTGSAGLDMALSFLGKLGIDPDHAGMKAAATGDFSILKATLATMGDKAQGWEANIALGEKAFTDRVESDKVRAAADREAIMKVAGGEAEWARIREFAAAATADSPAEREEVNRVLNGGGLAAKAMAAYLKGLADAHAPVKEPANATNPGAASTAAPTNGALSPREYTAEVQKLRAGFRGDFDGSPQYAALKARRAAWRDPRSGR